MAKVFKRTVYFYQIQRQMKHSMDRVPENNFIEWDKVLDKFQSLSPEKRVNEETSTFYSVNNVSGSRVVTIAESADTSLFVNVDQEHGEVHNLVPDALNNNNLKLAQVSLLFFYKKYNLVAFLSAAQGRTTSKKAEEFFNKNFHDDDYDWQLENVWEKGAFEKFVHDVSGAYELNASFTTQRMLTENIPTDTGVGKLVDQLSNETGASLNVQFKITIPKEERTRANMKRFKSMSLSGIMAAMRQNKRASVGFMNDDDALVQLDFNNHAYVKSVELPRQPDGQQYTQLMNEFVKICKHSEKDVVNLVEGE